MMCLTIVVLPALSSPLAILLAGAVVARDLSIEFYSIRTRISLSFRRALRKIDNMMALVELHGH